MRNLIFFTLLFSSSCLANLPGDEEGHDGMVDRNNFAFPYDNEGFPMVKNINKIL